MAGASGYLLKQVKGTDLVDAIRRVAAGRVAARPGDDGRACSNACARRPRRTSSPA